MPDYPNLPQHKEARNEEQLPPKGHLSNQRRKKRLWKRLGRKDLRHYSPKDEETFGLDLDGSSGLNTHSYAVLNMHRCNHPAWGMRCYHPTWNLRPWLGTAMTPHYPAPSHGQAPLRPRRRKEAPLRPHRWRERRL